MCDEPEEEEEEEEEEELAVASASAPPGRAAAAAAPVFDDEQLEKLRGMFAVEWSFEIVDFSFCDERNEFKWVNKFLFGKRNKKKKKKKKIMLFPPRNFYRVVPI